MTTSLHTEENETFHKGLFYCVETGIKREVQNQEKKKKKQTQRETMCQSGLGIGTAAICGTLGTAIEKLD